MHSSDGSSWHEGTSTVTSGRSLDGLAYGDGRFVAVGTDGGYHGANGDRWEKAKDSIARNYLNAVVWGGERFVAVDVNPAYSRRSGEK